MAKKKEKIIVEVKSYSVKHIRYDDGTVLIERLNDGFTGIELLGYLEQVQLEIIYQMKNVIKANKTKRIVKPKN